MLFPSGLGLQGELVLAALGVFFQIVGHGCIAAQ